MATNLNTPSTTEPTSAGTFDVSDYLDLNDAAKELGIAPYHLREASKKGKLPVKVLGSRTLVSKANLKAFLDSGERLVTRTNRSGGGRPRTVKPETAPAANGTASTNGASAQHKAPAKEAVAA